jgi:CRISPR-associated exonuclease Cas4
MSWLFVVALVLALLGWLLIVFSTRGREKRGLGPGETVALDNVTLFSERLLLVGRPDRLVRTEEGLIPEEWKPSKKVYPSHRVQLGAYFLLVEEEYGERPPYGVVILGQVWTLDEAAEVVATLANQNKKDASALLESEGFYRFCYREAAKAAHPDSGGSEATFKRLQSARDFLEDHFKAAVNQ